MKLISVAAQNFGSYKQLDFNLSGQGLTLISGPTGAGKSTLCDLVPWTLFGKTAKNGQADEVRSWGIRDTTSASVQLYLNNEHVVVYRARGNKDNDLYFWRGNGPHERGKDIPDRKSTRLNSSHG